VGEGVKENDEVRMTSTNGAELALFVLRHKIASIGKRFLNLFAVVAQF